jgi:hypothetical protein
LDGEGFVKVCDFLKGKLSSVDLNEVKRHDRMETRDEEKLKSSLRMCLFVIEAL